LGPIAVGAALLAWLGGDGRQIDQRVSADTGDLDVALPRSMWGTRPGSSSACPGLFGWGKSRVASAARVQIVLAVTACGVVALAWLLALR
jgi:hypothetical protein